MEKKPKTPVVQIVMGSSSDWDTMSAASEVLTEFNVPHGCHVISAHRMPDDLFKFAEGLDGSDVQAVIAGAGGAAHLPGMLAAKTTVPILGVPVQTRALNGLDSLYSIVQMPRGIPVATFAIGSSGAANAALFAVAVLARSDSSLRAALQHYRNCQTARARAMTDELKVRSDA